VPPFFPTGSFRVAAAQDRWETSLWAGSHACSSRVPMPKSTRSKSTTPTSTARGSSAFSCTTTIPRLPDFEGRIDFAPASRVAYNFSESWAPFDKPELRRAVALTIDRKAFVDTLTEGKGDFGGVMLPPPEGVWGMPADMLKGLPGYNPDVPKNHAEARGIMEKLGYGPNKPLKLTVSTRNIPPYRDPAVILIDQLKEIHIDGELDPIDTAQWLPRVMRGDYTIALNLTGNGLDDPDQTLYENFTCGAEGNYDRYCSSELDKMVDRQSMEFEPAKRKELVWAGWPRHSRLTSSCKSSLAQAPSDLNRDVRWRGGPGGALKDFYPLFPKYAYFTEAQINAPINMVDVFPSVTIQPRRDFAVTAGVNFLWRYSTRDGFYQPPGVLLVPSSVHDGALAHVFDHSRVLRGQFGMLKKCRPSICRRSRCPSHPRT
jgi:hypothetical protein